MIWQLSCSWTETEQKLVKHESTDIQNLPARSALRVWRLWFTAAVVLVALLAVGFFLFVDAVKQDAGASRLKADGIVALTGTQQRIREAAKLLADGQGRRLLVSGVNPQATEDELRRLTTLDQRKFNCCVDLGYEARDTIGNAEEARAWVDAHGFTSIIVVTSDYHVPRSLAEFGRVMPNVKLIPFAVASGHRDGRAWWTSPGTIRVLAAEYVKFLPSAIRFTLVRLARAIESKIASTPQQPGRS